MMALLKYLSDNSNFRFISWLMSIDMFPHSWYDFPGSWYDVCLLNYILNILGIKLWDSGSYLIFLLLLSTMFSCGRVVGGPVDACLFSHIASTNPNKNRVPHHTASLQIDVKVHLPLSSADIFPEKVRDQFTLLIVYRLRYKLSFTLGLPKQQREQSKGQILIVFLLLDWGESSPLYWAPLTPKVR